MVGNQSQTVVGLIHPADVVAADANQEGAGLVWPTPPWWDGCANCLRLLRWNHLAEEVTGVADYRQLIQQAGQH